METKAAIPAQALALAGEWQRLRPAVEAALPRLGGSHTWADLAQAVAAGTMTFLPGERSFILFTVERSPQLVRVIILLAGGISAADEVECMQLVDEALEWAATRAGAKQAMLCLRPGIERIIDRRGEGESAHGWRKLASVYVKDLG